MERHWYIVLTPARHEKKIAAMLVNRGYESFVATQTEVRLWSRGRRRSVERVVIPCVVFVHCTDAERLDVLTLPGALRNMMDRVTGKPARIPDGQIDRLRWMLGHAVSPVGFVSGLFRARDKVRIIRGSLQGLEGTVSTDSDGSHILIVELPALMGGATVRISPAEVEKV